MNKTEKHTPGPWGICKNLPIFNGATVIASAHIDDAIICSMGHDVREVEANARLIATAPEMLDVLERTFKRYWELRDHDATNHEFSCVMSDVENIIAKAKGSRLSSTPAMSTGSDAESKGREEFKRLENGP